MENGDIGAMNRVSATRARPHDLDIKLLQAKRQQAEMRRYIFSHVISCPMDTIKQYYVKFLFLEHKERMTYGKIIHSLTHHCLLFQEKALLEEYVNVLCMLDMMQG